MSRRNGTKKRRRGLTRPYPSKPLTRQRSLEWRGALAYVFLVGGAA